MQTSCSWAAIEDPFSRTSTNQHGFLRLRGPCGRTMWGRAPSPVRSARTMWGRAPSPVRSAQADEFSRTVLVTVWSLFSTVPVLSLRTLRLKASVFPPQRTASKILSRLPNELVFLYSVRDQHTKSANSFCWRKLNGCYRKYLSSS
jgi:hypothetical protein